MCNGGECSRWLNRIHSPNYLKEQDSYSKNRANFSAIIVIDLSFIVVIQLSLVSQISACKL